MEVDYFLKRVEGDIVRIMEANTYKFIWKYIIFQFGVQTL